MLRAAVIVLTGSLLAGCSSKMAPPLATPALSSETEANMIANLRDGRADLHCGAACAETWRGSLPKLDNLYVTRDWLHLATLAMQIGYQNDLAYYYLGQSAEGLGSPKAAVKFYRTAGALASRTDPQFKCKSGEHDFCNGLSFPRDLYIPIQTAQRHVASIPVSQTHVSARKLTTTPSASNPAQTPPEVVVPVSVPAQDEAWIEPPPVTR